MIKESHPHLPKADLHVHSESAPRMDRIEAARNGRRPYDWAGWRSSLLAIPPGDERLARMNGEIDVEALDALDTREANFRERVRATLLEAGAAGAVLVEIRFGAETALRPWFLESFRRAEAEARGTYQQLMAEPLISGVWPGRWESHERAEQIVQACLKCRDEGLAGVDFIPVPYSEEADWSEARVWASEFTRTGLGITAHAGEFTTANIESALGLPGLTRLGHGIRVIDSPQLLDEVMERDITLECCLTSNLVYGGIPGIAAHPLPKLLDAGARVTINTDCPVRLVTSIDREYALAEAALGSSARSILEGITRTAIEASFAPAQRKHGLLERSI